MGIAVRFTDAELEELIEGIYAFTLRKNAFHDFKSVTFRAFYKLCVAKTDLEKMKQEVL